MNSERVRLGIVGLGRVAQAVHLPLLVKHADLFAVSALCDLSPGVLDAIVERFPVASGRRYRQLGDLLGAGSLDAVMVLTSGSHGAACGAAVQAGLPVFCEKPLAYTLAEADALATPSLRLMVGYMKLYDPAVRRALGILAKRPPPRSVEVTVLHPSAESQLTHVGLVGAADVPEETVAAQAAEAEMLVWEALGPAPPPLGRLYADVLLGSIVHDLALVRRLVGDPVRIEHVDVWPDQVFPPSVSVIGLLPGDVRVSIRWHYLDRYPAYREEVRVHDEQGTLALVFPSPWVLHAPTKLIVAEVADDGARTTRFGSTLEAFEEQLLAFHRLVVDDNPPAAGLAEGRADVVTCQRIVRRFAELRGLPIGGEAAGS